MDRGVTELHVRLSIFFLLICAFAVPARSQSASSSFRSARHAESKGNYDAAYEGYRRAHEKRPNDPAYTAAYLKSRLYAASQHIQTGESLRDVYKLQDALAEFRRAAEIDSSNFEAFQEIRRTADLINKQKTLEHGPLAPPVQEISAVARAASAAAPPVSLVSFPSEEVSLHLTAPSDVIYKTVAKLAGINVLIDPEYKPQKMTMELKDVDLRDALSMIALQSRTFWRPVSANTILVSADNGGKRKDLEQNVMMTFYLKNASTPADLQQAASTLKGILDITRIQTTPEQRSLTIRATPDQLVLAERLLRDIDKPRAEVMIEIAVLQVSKGRIMNLGVNPPTSISASVQPNVTGASGGVLTLGSLGSAFNANNILVTIPGASLTALMSDSNTKVIQKPQLRAMDSEKASLKIGDRIPVATGSYQSGLSNGVNTQFTYIDVGVNVDVVPYVHANREVTLKMAFEVSTVTGEQSVDGVTEPTIGQRRIEHQVRVADGEVNLIGGILQDSEAHSLSGLPWLGKIPVLKYLFGQENKDREQNEVVFAITPHIVRSRDGTEENERMVDIGTGSSVTYRTIGAAEPPPPAPGADKARTDVPAAPTPSAREAKAPVPARQ